jgi:hypothetical protein
MMRYVCCDERRRNAVAARTDLNGIAFLEVQSVTGPDGALPTLLVLHFINAVALPPLTPQNVAISGGSAIRGVRVTTVQAQTVATGTAPVLAVTVDRPGDFSIYQLTLVAADGTMTLPGIDPILGAIDFSFRAGCESDFDVVLSAPCPPTTAPAPSIDYLARDFNSLRQLLLDRMAVLGAPLPSNDPVDLGVTLVELLAYVGDQLSYRQDAIATESTLQTARQRISARRHARLVDYVMHNGCNARCFVVVTMKPAATAAIGPGVQLLTGVPATAGLSTIPPGSPVLAEALSQGALVFETLGTVSLDARLDGMRFHTWGATGCCLPKGATSATLIGDLAGPDALCAGRFVVLREMVDPLTGDAALADPSHRWTVRLTSARSGPTVVDPIGGSLQTPAVADPLRVTEIAWGLDDALPFPICISVEANSDLGIAARSDVSLVFGNVLLADHGQSLAEPEALGVMPSSTLFEIAAPQPVDSLTDIDFASACGETVLTPVPARFTPVLSQGELTHAVPYAPAAGDPAVALLRTDPASAQPAIQSVQSVDPNGTTTWQAAFPDMVGAAAEPLFVVEVDNALRGQLRFGDGTNGRVPTPGAAFSALYRIGNGSVGNVGAGTISCIVTAAAIAGVTNPLPATGGVDAETIDAVRRHAPAAFRQNQLRAVTPQDYAEQAGLYPGVRRASATLRWTGSWYTHFIAVDRGGEQALDPGFDAGLQTALDAVRLAGHDLQLVEPIDVGVELALTIQVIADHFRSAVRQAILATLNDQPGNLFDPDGFTFGQPVYLSPIIAAAQSTPGVAAVAVTMFQRLNQPATDARASGRLIMAKNEIARLDNDPNYPERGVLRLTLTGGR